MVLVATWRVALKNLRVALKLPCGALKETFENPWQILNHDAARRVATVFENLNCMIKTYLLARSEKTSYIKIDPLRAFCRDPLPPMPIT